MKNGKSNTWRFFKEAVADHFQKTAVRAISAGSVVLSLALVFGANLIFHGGDHTPIIDSTQDESFTNQPKSADAGSSENHAGSRSLASVNGAVQSASSAQSASSTTTESYSPQSVNSDSSKAAPKPALGAPLRSAGGPAISAPQTSWNNINAPSNNSNLDKSPNGTPPSGAQDQNSGNGTISSSGDSLPNPTPSTAVPVQNSAGFSSASSVETNGQLTPATAYNTGFAITSGGSLGTGTGMLVETSIGQVTGPNIQNGNGVTLVSGLIGTTMVNF